MMAIGDTAVFEPLGSNCEFGFILQHLGHGAPSLLRWTAIQIDNLHQMLDANFQDAFEEEEARPHGTDMIMMKRFEWAFHSALKSCDGEFVLEPVKLKKLFRIERARVLASIEAFRERLRNGKVICVFSSDGVSNEQVIDLRKAIDRFSGHCNNALLVVSGNTGGQAVGESVLIGHRTWRGTVSRLAPWDRSNDADYPNWSKLLIATRNSFGDAT
jgi:hypothetical protein